MGKKTDLGDPTCWTDREREFFAEGWNECVRMQPGDAVANLTAECDKLREALQRIETRICISSFRAPHDDDVREIIRSALNQRSQGAEKCGIVAQTPQAFGPHLCRWRFVKCVGKHDICECSKCGRLRKFACNFDDE